MIDLINKVKAIDRELQRRKSNNKLASYNTGKLVHQKQLEFHRCPSRNRWVFGGNRSGKTECGAVESVYMARGVHPYRDNRKNTVGWVVSLSTQVQRDVAQSKILYYINPDWIVDIVMLSGKKDSPENGVIDYITIRNVFGGTSKIGFKSCDQGREKFQGTSLDFVWFDEEPPRDIYIECRMRVLDKCGDIFGTMTPLKGLSWVYDEIYLNSNNDPEIWNIFIEWADNPYLSQEEIKQLSSTLSQDELQSRRYGKFIDCGGLVYSEFDPSIHIIEPFAVPKEWYDNISIDPGLNNPLSAHWYACDYDGNIYVIAEHYEAGKTVDYHAKKLLEISDRLGWHRSFGGRLEALIDSAATQRTLASEKSVVELFYDYGLVVNPKVNKDMYSGLSRVKSYLKDANGRAKLFIFSCCVNLIREIKGYFWGNGDMPVKRDDHSLDELRYYIMNRPETKSPTPSKSLIQKDKDRLAKRLGTSNKTNRRY